MNFQKAKQRLLRKTSSAFHQKGCKQFLGTKQNVGKKKPVIYGIIIVDGKKFYAHKLALLIKLAKTSLEKGLITSHLCHNTLCVNEKHLNAETVKLNNKRKICNNDQWCIGHGRAPKCIF